MIRGLYTGASGMIAQDHRMDALANNLANVDTAGYKRDQAIHKAFPELLLRRFNDNGTVHLPLSGSPPHLGSTERAPVVGTLGTGVELNEIFTIFEQGPLKQTENSFDLALEGAGFFVVDTPYGERLTRNGGFLIGPEGLLVTKEGYPVLGENGPIAIVLNNFVVDQDGRVFQNALFAETPGRPVTVPENQWDQPQLVDRLRVVDAPSRRYLQKQGSSLWRTTPDSGESFELAGGARPAVRQGFIETSNVNAVTQMVQLIEVNRAYEANQKVIHTQDQSTERLLGAVRL